MNQSTFESKNLRDGFLRFKRGFFSSIDSLQQDVFEQRERNRQLRQPPVDYDSSRSFRPLSNASPNSSYI